MMRKTALHGLAEIFEQVPLVRHLKSLGSSEPGGGGIGITTIPADDLDRGVASEPGRHRSDLSIRQDIEPTMPFQVTDECPIAVAATPGPVVYTDHTRCFDRLIGKTTHQPQDGIWATAHGQDCCQTRGWLS